jgi:N-acetylmuramoyl-L-alanine amidase
MKSAKLLLFILLLSGFSSTSFMIPAPNPADGKIKTVIIDPGHGGKDPGAVGKRYYEKDIALKVGLQLKRILNENLPHIKVVMTRDTDEFIELHQRATMAQENKGDFFISIHCNALENRSKFGTETYVLGINPGQENYKTIIAENEAILFEDNHAELYGGFDPSSPEGFIYFKLLKNVFRTASFRLAHKVQHQYGSRLGRKSRGVKQAPFIVLYLSGMPAILTEMGFISNYKEESFLASEVGQIFLATGMYRAIKGYNMEF